MSNLKKALKTCKYCKTEFYGVKKSIFCSAKCKNGLLSITNREKRFACCSVNAVRLIAIVLPIPS